jgi:flagellar biosynthesis/type III secretory pathway M-ring protein FliF/YscJ
MFNAEDVGMIDDIVRLLMGDGSIFVQTEVPTFYDDEEEEEEVEENQGNNSETKTKDPEQEGVEAQSSAMPDTQEASKMEKSEDSEDSNGNTSNRGFGETKGDLDIEIEDFGF